MGADARRTARRATLPVTLLVLAACGGRAASRTFEAVPISGAQAEAEISRVVLEALQRDAAWADASELYAREPIIVADGERRHTYPLFAAIDSGGQVGITSSRIEIGPTLAWAYVEYRWLSTRRGTASAGLATFVLSPGRTDAPWSIVHVHSSTAP
jgi:hypothetical protein